MKKYLALALFTSMLSAPAFAANMPLKRVVITTSGIALYEHQGQVTGNENIDIPVRLDRVDDMLKSLVVLDKNGKLGGVSLPGKQPLEQAFRDLPFSESDLSSPVDLLNALRGASVEVTGGSAINGKLMSVTQENEATQTGTITRHRITVLTSDGIKSAVIERLDALKFNDEKVRDQLSRGLEALFNNRIIDQRGIEISLIGEGTRDVALAYLQDAPLWKSSYRLVLPQEGSDAKAILQGWAVLENTTGQDWDNVNVTLMSGSPVTYQQALYESYYVSRPNLPLKIMDRIVPRADTGNIGKLSNVEHMMESAAAMPAPAAPLMKSARSISNLAMGAVPAEMDAMGESFMQDLAQVSYASASETASQMVFTFPQAISLQAGHTLMLPFASYDLPAEKIYVYQMDTSASHPLAAIKLENDTASALPPGILTLFDKSENGLIHVGDAEMPLVPKNEDRFISYALDTNTKLDMRMEDDRTLGLITIEDGILKQNSIALSTTTYIISAPEDEDRTITIEHPRREGWEMMPPEDIIGEPEVAKEHYRVSVKVPKGETKTFKITLKSDGYETISLLSASPKDLEARMAAAGKDLPENMRKSIKDIIEMRKIVAKHEKDIAALENERNRIYTDQKRLRENLQSVDSGNDLGKRYLKQMDEQETRLEQIAKDEATAIEALRKANETLASYISKLKL